MLKMSYGYNSTIRRKKKACVSCGKPSYIFSKGRCADCARIEDTMQKIEEESERMIEIDNLSDLIKRADEVVSRYVRMSAADKNGIVECYTCGVKKHFSLMDAGHYIPRGCMLLRFDVDRNIRVQCRENCNRDSMAQKKVMAEYTRKLELEKPGVTEILKEEFNIVYKISRDELYRTISEYTQKVNFLKEKFKK